MNQVLTSPRAVIAPTEEEWRAMSPAQRERLVVQVIDSLSEPPSAMAEGRPHSAAKAKIVDVIGLHFRSEGRAIYLAADMAVLYPAQATFAPDVLVVLDVGQPASDPRLAWVVADEGRGLDLVFEVLPPDDRMKDREDNVKRFACLGIREYFVYDLARQKIHGHRLPARGVLYEPIASQAGRFRSTILGVDLAIVGGTLRFFTDESELAGTPDLLRRIQGKVDDLHAKAQQRAAQADQALAVARDGIVTVLAVRGIPCPEDVTARIAGCSDPSTLQRWLQRATIAPAAVEVVEAQESLAIRTPTHSAFYRVQ